MMRTMLLAFVPLLSTGGSIAQVPPVDLSPVNGAASQPQYRRSDVRQAVAAQRTGSEPSAAVERRLTQQEREVLRQQIREHGGSGRR